MSLLPHNIPVYENLCDTLEISGKAIIITFTGGGKTYMPLEYLEEHDIRNALVVAPKLSICNEWLEKTDRVVTTTYQAFAKMSVESLCKHPVIIMDEVHHAGSQVWGKKFRALLDKVDPDQTKIIGLTCDDIRWSDGGKSVAEEFFKDCVVPGYDIVDALEMGLVNPFTYVCALHELTDTVQKTATRAKNAPTQRKVIIDRLVSRLQFHSKNIWNITNILHEHMPKSPIKGIIFCDNIAAIPEAQSLIANAYPDIEQFVIHSKLPNDTNAARIQAFKNCNDGFCFNVNMFGEGMHVDGINAIIMFRRTQSPAVFFQQIGRGISVGGVDNLVIFDIVGNQHTLKTLSVRQAKQLNLFKRIESEKPNQVAIHNYAADALTILQNIEQLLWKNTPWTAAEDAILYKYYPNEGCRTSERLPGRNAQACFARASKLKIVANTNRWTSEEDTILYKYYPNEGRNVSKRLPGRTADTCQQRAEKLGIKSMSPQSTAARAWTPEEDAILLQYYPIDGPDVYKRLQNRTAQACQTRAQKINATPIRGTSWSDQEIAILTEYYYVEGEHVSKRLPGRSNKACAQQARVMGMLLSKSWHPQEDAVLLRYYPIENEAITKRLLRRSAGACEQRYRALTKTNK